MTQGIRRDAQLCNTMKGVVLPQHSVKHSNEQKVDPEKIQKNRNLQTVANTNIP